LDKILVEIYIPGANKSYDVYIPLRIKLHEVMSLLAVSLTELSQGYIISKDDAVICNKLTGKILDINMSAEEHKLFNGSKLMLI
jgi:hypothetical protein